jgi:hypothetical protein
MGCIRLPKPEAMRFKSSFFTGCIAGIEASKASLFLANVAISSSDLDCIISLLDN